MERELHVVERVLHIRFEGKSFDIPQNELDIGGRSSDRQVKAAVAAYLDVPDSRFRHYVVERHENGNVTIRPEAVFG